MINKNLEIQIKKLELKKDAKYVLVFDEQTITKEILHGLSEYLNSADYPPTVCVMVRGDVNTAVTIMELIE